MGQACALYMSLPLVVTSPYVEDIIPIWREENLERLSDK